MPQILIRPAIAGDLEALIDLETRAMHFPMGHRIREWFREDFPGDHRQRFMVAECEGRLVSAAALVPLPIRYRGVDLQAAYWEAVVTDEAFRRQGLCRRLFDALTPKDSYDAIFVWGATWLYRRLGYHPALRNFGGLDSVKRTARAAEMPASPLTVRPANSEDAPFLARLRVGAGSRSVVSVPVSERAFRHDLRPDRTVAGPGETGLNRWQEWRILERGDEAVGYFMHDPWDLACLMEFEIAIGKTTWREAGATAIQATAAFVSGDEVTVTLPNSHPVYAAFPHAIGRPSRPHGDVAARILDLASSVRKIAPALEAQLATSPMAGWTGELTLSRIDDGIRVLFENGAFVEAIPWEGNARVSLMPGRFEALALGYRSIRAILDEDPDCHADEETEALLAALFPPGDSFMRPI